LRRRTASGLVVAAVAAAVLAGCTYSAEPAPDQPASPNEYSTSGFPAPGPAPVPGQITPAPVQPPQPANEPRPPTGPTPTRGPAETGAPPAQG
jgi:hypothetical protein